MAPQKQGRKVAIIGGSGQVGYPTIKALLAQQVHTITAVQRVEATSTFPSEVIVKIGDLQDESFLADAFKGQDVVALMPPFTQMISVQEPAVRAAAKAGIPYVLPAEYGPDPFAQRLIEQNELLQNKKRTRDLIEELGVSSWVSVTVGPFIDMHVGSGLWGFDFENRKATLWNGSVGTVSGTDTKHTGQAVAAVLTLPEGSLSRYKNNAVYTPALHFTQPEFFEAAQRATGTTEKDWSVENHDIEEALKDCNAKIEQGDAMAPLSKFMLTHFQEGNGGDLRSKVDDNEFKKLHELGLEEEKLEDVIKSALG
ncbi:putative oxidoreductase CipA-like protein [Fusarium flagelliforme]|uniref:putative oxidoreductase CipA-like protein n=1 Tax=Fusarium flagelliforme TaxID=2675880 RepID=UPI001E8CB80D|nr:putative oxidoreductase CipA-like protein [Fusarium flagelliforme]KAH7184840.1 putative oxidoreductase CipA-like protein [Fusarium flagelliforme]